MLGVLAFNGVTISPLPSTAAKGPLKKKGMSEPSMPPKPASSSLLNSSPHSLFKPASVHAASLLPPPRPADMGISFFNVITAPFLTDSLSFIRIAAL